MALILVVDDVDAVRQVIRRILETTGHTVIEAGDGHAALSILRQVQSIDLVITDLVMPGKEGIETIMEIRREYSGVRILAISGTAQGGAPYLNAATALGADAVLSKPFRADMLLEIVSRLLASLPARSGLGPT